MTKGFRVLIYSMLAVTFLAAIVSTILAAASFTRTIRTTTVYRTVSYSQQDLCPGDVLTMTVEFQVLTAPTLVSIYDSWWSITENRTAIQDKEPTYAVETEPDDITTTIAVPVPQLQPGLYEYRRAAQDDGSPLAAFAVPFTIMEGCHK